LALQNKTVLITVKAPPNFSNKYQETNCCAGIDLETNQWIRLYPIPFRLLDNARKFPKYSIIKVKCEKPPRDKRIESFKVDQDSIQVLQKLGTKNKWAERKQLVLNTLSSSFCQIYKNIDKKMSIGVFKPCDINFVIKKEPKKKDPKDHPAYNQYWLFDKQLKPPEYIPFAFYYKFKCSNKSDCSGHILKIHDWEITEAYRNWKLKYKEEKVLLEKIKERWLDRMCSEKNDVYFYVGNQWMRPKNFMVLGVFYPQK